MISNDLHQQIEAADKQLKATRQFLEDQAAEREQERDEFSKEIEKLRVIVKEKDKDKTSQDIQQKEVKHFVLITLLCCRFVLSRSLHSLILFFLLSTFCTIKICMLKNKKLDIGLVIDHVSLVLIE